LQTVPDDLSQGQDVFPKRIVSRVTRMTTMKRQSCRWIVPFVLAALGFVQQSHAQGIVIPGAFPETAAAIRIVGG